MGVWIIKSSVMILEICKESTDSGFMRTERCYYYYRSALFIITDSFDYSSASAAWAAASLAIGTRNGEHDT